MIHIWSSRLIMNLKLGFFTIWIFSVVHYWISEIYQNTKIAGGFTVYAGCHWQRRNLVVSKFLNFGCSLLHLRGDKMWQNMTKYEKCDKIWQFVRSLLLNNTGAFTDPKWFQRIYQKKIGFVREWIVNSTIGLYSHQSHVLCYL